MKGMGSDWEKLVGNDEDDQPATKVTPSLCSRCDVHKHFRFKTSWMLYYILVSTIGGLAISCLDNLPFVDGIFIAAAAMTGAGLSTVSMLKLSVPSFCIMGVLILIGCCVFMLLPTILCRRYYFGKVNAQMDALRKAKALPLWKDLSIRERQIISEYLRLDDALGVLGVIVMIYLVGFLLFGIMLLNAALHLRPLQAELAARKLTYLDSAAFLAVSAFGNAGCTITSDSLVGLSDNPAAYMWIAFLIIAGNSALPIFLRSFISAILRLDNFLFPYYSRHIEEDWKLSFDMKRDKYRRLLQYILDNPRKLTTHLFSHMQTKVLSVLVASLIGIQYFFFIVSTLDRGAAMAQHSRLSLAGIGFFQTTSTRAAGFTIMDLRQLNQGLLVIYFVMMYMSSFPFISIMEKTTEHEDAIGADFSESDKDIHYLQSSSSASVNEDQRLPGGLRNRSVFSHPNLIIPSISILRTASNDESQKGNSKKTNKFYDLHRAFAKTYFFRHSFFVFLSILALAYTEDSVLNNPKLEVNLWYVMFEVISAYGNIGLSLGIPGESYSLSGALSAKGKCILIGLMWLGKHRGLPSAGDEVVDFAFHRYRIASRLYEQADIDQGFAVHELPEERDYVIGKNKVLIQAHDTHKMFREEVDGKSTTQVNPLLVEGHHVV